MSEISLNDEEANTLVPWTTLQQFLPPDFVQPHGSEELVAIGSFWPHVLPEKRTEAYIWLLRWIIASERQARIRAEEAGRGGADSGRGREG